MKKTTILIFSCALLTTFSGQIHAADTRAAPGTETPAATSAPQDRLEQIRLIDVELQKLFIELHNRRMKVNHAQMDAQIYRQEDYSVFVDDIKQAEENEKQVEAIKEKILNLYAQKQALIEKTKQ